MISYIYQSINERQTNHKQRKKERERVEKPAKTRGTWGRLQPMRWANSLMRFSVYNPMYKTSCRYFILI